MAGQIYTKPLLLETVITPRGKLANSFSIINLRGVFRHFKFGLDHRNIKQMMSSTKYTIHYRQLQLISFKILNMNSRISLLLVASVCLASSFCFAANLDINFQQREIQPTITNNNNNNIILTNGQNKSRSMQELSATPIQLMSLQNAEQQNNSKNSNENASRMANFGTNLPQFGNIVLDSHILDGLGGLLTIDEDQQSSFFQEQGNYQANGSGNGRESRRFAPVRSNLGSLWNKPKVSPLYLINGTVCRFVNSNPICTTLSTQGLLRK